MDLCSKPRHRDTGREATVTTGLILLVFIAVLVAWVWTRFSRRLGIRVAWTWRGWLAFVAVFAVAVLALWASSTSH
jgi:ABC-type uncharacterized transport system permease subunit